MLRTFKSATLISSALFVIAIPAAFAAGHGHSGGGGHGYSGSSRGYSGGHSGEQRSYSGGGRQAFVAPRGNYSRGYSGGYSYRPGRTYIEPRRGGYYRGGIYFGYSNPYYYGYDTYAYGPGYYAPAPVVPACSQGYYDANGAWVPDPSCYGAQPSPPAQQYYAPNQSQPYSAPPQQYYDPNQQQYPPPQY
jgi:hypothetical protein